MNLGSWQTRRTQTRTETPTTSRLIRHPRNETLHFVLLFHSQLMVSGTPADPSLRFSAVPESCTVLSLTHTHTHTLRKCLDKPMFLTLFLSFSQESVPIKPGGCGVPLCEFPTFFSPPVSRLECFRRIYAAEHVAASPHSSAATVKCSRESLTRPLNESVFRGGSSPNRLFL